MSAYPLMLDGAQLLALVVGGGAVAVRKVGGLLEAGATVRVVAPVIAPALRALAGAAGGGRLSLEERPYAPADIGAALLVIAATDDRAVNARVAADARGAGRLVNVADAPDEGTCWTAATHRAGALVVAVSAGGVPAVAARVRDAIALRFDARYGDAVDGLHRLRRRLLDADRAGEWRDVSATVVAADFCDAVEQGTLAARVPPWG